MEPVSIPFSCITHGLLNEDGCYVYGKNVRCKQCLKEKNHARYLNNKSAIIARVKAYGKAHPEKGKLYREIHREDIKQRQSSWYKRNSEMVKTKTAEYRKSHQTEMDVWKKKYQAENKDRFSIQKKAYRQSKPDFIQKIKREYARYVKSAALYFYSNGTMQCALCGDPHFNHLCLDHVEGGGTQHRLKDPGTRGKAVYAWCKRNDYPPIFRVLCWNCNFLVIPRAEPTSSKQIRYMRRLKEKVLSHYAGGEPICSKCGNQDIRVLTIDHVNKGGRKHLAGLKIKGGTTFYRWLQSGEFPAGYRVLCFNCNCGGTT